VLPEAEEVARLGGVAPAGPGLSPLKKTFTPPPSRTAALTTPVLPEAEAVAKLSGAAPAGPGLSPLKKTFTPPPGRVVSQGTASLPEAEAVAKLSGAAPAGAGLSPLKKTCTPPPGRGAPVGTPALPDAEAVAGVQGAAPAGPNLGPLRKTFVPPPTNGSPSRTAPSSDLPEVSAAHLAIVSLDPAKTPVLPAPPPPRNAGFSAGPKPEPGGAATDGGAAGVVVPTVTVRDGPTRQSLLAAIRPMAPPTPAGPPPDSALPATRVASAPDPMLEGRVIYTLAIQMPNVTSYSGSWMVWYAERRQSFGGGAMRAPNPVRKVDPKYIAAAAAEGVQGVVRLAAVIRQDGHVDDVKLLRHLDDRLDRSAMEALGKWQFEPASRDGAPVEVDAVFEIPFRLAPKLSK
jgi:TonB family protein